jgi:hypothetical protein
MNYTLRRENPRRFAKDLAVFRVWGVRGGLTTRAAENQFDLVTTVSTKSLLFSGGWEAVAASQKSLFSPSSLWSNLRKGPGIGALARAFTK